MKTLILPPRYTEDSSAISKAAGRDGWSVERLPSWHIPSILRDEDVCVYGEPLFVMHAAAELDLALIETPYRWLGDLPEEYVRRFVQNMTMAQARTIGARMFIKPAMEKFFRATVFESGDALPDEAAVADQIPVIAAEPVEWEIEFRCFVKDRNCLAMSPYLRNGELAHDQEGVWHCTDAEQRAANAFIAEILDSSGVMFPPATVIDIGEIRGRGWAIVESNPAWGSGIYGCDPAAVLKVVERSCFNRKQLSPGDELWMIDHSIEDFR